MEERKTSEEQFKYKRSAGIAISVVFAVFGFIAVFLGVLFKTWVLMIIGLAVGVCFSVIAAFASKRGKKENNETEEGEAQSEDEYLATDEQPTTTYKNTAKESKVVKDLRKVYRERQIMVLSYGIIGAIACVVFFCIGVIMNILGLILTAILVIIPTIANFACYMYYEDKINEAGNDDKKFNATKKYKITKRCQVQSTKEQSEETHATTE
ncbi:MAG TPA: hypothetical protein DDY77_01280 [Clostridiales bacterium]|nr:hypothetical protein [Clostridiales bacterium]